MFRYRNCLPQMSGNVFLTDGGLETTLIFHEEIALPKFAAFLLPADPTGRRHLERYYRKYINIAHRYECGFILESATWRASPDWAERLEVSARGLAELNSQAIDLLVDLRSMHETAGTPMVVAGCVGPRGDGYSPAVSLTELDAQVYHSVQIDTFRQTQADMISATNMTHTAEAIGIARAARAAKMPCSISFAVGTDGCLPTGQSLREAIHEVDDATGQMPAYYSISCVHPDHLMDVLSGGAGWLDRIGGIRASAFGLKRAVPDQSGAFDGDNPMELDHHYFQLRTRLRNLGVFGGCCGTDHRHIEEICKALALQSHACAA